VLRRYPNYRGKPANGITTAFDMLGMNPLDFLVYHAAAHVDNFPLRIFGGKIITAAQGAALNTKGGRDNEQEDIFIRVHHFMHGT